MKTKNTTAATVTGGHNETEWRASLVRQTKNLAKNESHSAVIDNAFLARELGVTKCPYEIGTDNFELWNECRFGKVSDQQPKAARSRTAKMAALIFMKGMKQNGKRANTPAICG